jgi:hypothetical protein
MTTDNAIIDSTTTEVAAEAEVQQVDNTEAQGEETEAEVTEGQDEGISEDSDKSDLPKEVKKALDKNKRYIRNLREREKALQAEVEKLRSEKIEPKQMNADEFQGSYGEYIKQQSLEEMKALLGQNQQKQQLDQLTLQQQQLMAEQNKAISQEATEYAKQSDDFAKVVPANADRFNVLPAEIQGLFFELESPSLAAYALAKEGKIEQLAFMSPYMAATEIYQAQLRGQQYLQASSKKQISNAPAPISSLKGSGKSQHKPLSQMSPSELDKWRKT